MRKAMIKKTEKCDISHKIGGKMKKVALGITSFASATFAGMTDVYANSFGTVQPKNNVDVFSAMGKIIGMLLTITRYVGIALLIYGVYEVVMSFTQDEASRKTKGIVMAMAGLIMIAMKTVLSTLGVIQ